MKILLSHNYYRHQGGEDQVLMAERDLLLVHGHQVVLYKRASAEITTFSLAEKLALPIGAIWSRRGYREVRDLIRYERPHLAHFHNVFPLISPAAYHACREEGLPVVQTLHNYRLLCAGAQFRRDGRVCEDCMGKEIPWPGVLHGCWRNSRVHTSIVAMMLAFHRLLGTWQKQVDIYVVLTEFARRKFIEGGLPAQKIAIKPNFIHHDPGPGDGSGNYVLFAGRISPEKGIRTLIHAWREVKEIPLKVVGDGPLMPMIQKAIQEDGLANVEILRRRSQKEVLELMKRARFLIFPSEWYEGFPMTLVEAFACGLPVLASRLGSMVEIIEDGHTGLLFMAGNPDDLREKVQWAWTHPKQMDEMGFEARKEYEMKYTTERNYEMLMDIYRCAIKRVQGSAG